MLWRTTNRDLVFLCVWIWAPQFYHMLNDTSRCTGTRTHTDTESMGKECERLDKDTERNRGEKRTRERAYVGDFIVPATAKKCLCACSFFSRINHNLWTPQRREKRAVSVFMSVCVHVYFSLIKFGKQKLQANEIIHLARFANEMNVREHTPRARERKWRKNRNSSNNKNVVARKRTERILLFLFFAD